MISYKLLTIKFTIINSNKKRETEEEIVIVYVTMSILKNEFEIVTVSSNFKIKKEFNSIK